MQKTVDLRGLVCPEPVLRTKKLLDDAAVLKVEALVNDEVNVNNLERLARSLKLQFHAQENEGGYRVVLEREHSDTGVAAKPAPAAEVASTTGTDSKVGTVVFISRDKLGDGDPEFSMNLLNVFLQTLLQSGHRPRAILLANTGVKLMDPDSPAIKVLNDLRDSGTDVFACGLCVEYYGLKEKIPTAQITNMFAICEYLMAADKVIQP
ncbi:MAG: sulfurtransferase-like selenium metabolism protein YedF [Terriglobales bacterium]